MPGIRLFMRPGLRNWLVFSAVAVTVAAACGPITEQDARRVLLSGREIQRIEEEEITPRLNELDRLELTEIQPREQRLHELEREMRALYEELIRPLESDTFESEPHPDIITSIREEFEAAFEELELQQRDLERESQRLSFDLQAEERDLLDGQNDDIRAMEDRLYSLDAEIEDLYREQESEVTSIYDTIHQLEQGLYGQDYNTASNQDQIYEDIQWMESEIVRIEDNFRFQIDSLEAERLALGGDVDQFYLQHDTSAIHNAIADLESQLDGLYAAVNAVYQAYDQQAAFYYASIEALYIELEATEPGSVENVAITEEIEALDAQLATLFQAEELEVGPLEADKANLEAELSALYLDHESDPDHLATNDADYEIRRINDEIEDIYNAIDQETAYYYGEIAALEAELNGSVNDASDLEAELAYLYEQIAGAEDHYRAKIQDLEDERFSLNDELRNFYRTFDDEMRDLEDEFARKMTELDEQRFELQELRWALEDEVRETMVATETSFTDDHLAVQDEIQAIYDEEIGPLEAEARALEEELDEFYALMRTLQTELQTVRGQLGAQEQQLGTALLDVLETAIDAFAEEGTASADNLPGLGFGRDYTPDFSTPRFEPDFDSLFPERPLDAEWKALQSAIDIYMADNGLASLPADDFPLAGSSSQRDWATGGTGQLDLVTGGYTNESTSQYYYCWNASGSVSSRTPEQHIC